MGRSCISISRLPQGGSRRSERGGGHASGLEYNNGDTTVRATSLAFQMLSEERTKISSSQPEINSCAIGMHCGTM